MKPGDRGTFNLSAAGIGLARQQHLLSILKRKILYLSAVSVLELFRFLAIVVQRQVKKKFNLGLANSFSFLNFESFFKQLCLF